jgi:hypothetical protein
MTADEILSAIESLDKEEKWKFIEIMYHKHYEVVPSEKRKEEIKRRILED